MANNCYNYIQITGEKTEIKEFSEMLKLDKTKGQDSGTDIYENLCEIFDRQRDDARWFEMDIHEFYDDQDEIIISGDSAWSPCLEIFTRISEKFTSFQIRYEYEEMGCDFAGYANITDGNCDDNCFKYWEGKIQSCGENEALSEVLSNELECYDTEEELIESDMYLAFSEESKKEILESFNS